MPSNIWHKLWKETLSMVIRLDHHISWQMILDLTDVALASCSHAEQPESQQNNQHYLGQVFARHPEHEYFSIVYALGLLRHWGANGGPRTLRIQMNAVACITRTHLLEASFLFLAAGALAAALVWPASNAPHHDVIAPGPS